MPNIKLSEIAKELNVGLGTIVDFMHENGYKDFEMNPNARLTDEQYELLVEEFESEFEYLYDPNKRVYAKIDDVLKRSDFDSFKDKCNCNIRKITIRDLRRILNSDRSANPDPDYFSELAKQLGFGLNQTPQTLQTGSVNQKSVNKKKDTVLDIIKNPDSRLFIDTCSIMHPRFKDALAKIKPILNACEKKICVPQSCRLELIKHASNPSNRNACNQATAGLAELDKIKDFVEYYGDETDAKHADNVFVSRFAQFRSKYYLFLITEDKNLKQDICNLNDSKSVNGKKIEVVNIDYIVNYKHYRDRTPSTSKVCSKKSKVFNIETKLTSIPDDIIMIESVPNEGDNVFTEDGKAICLTSKIKSGGEGSVYEVDFGNNYVAKIYHKDKLTERHKEKINLLVQSGIQIPGVCFPTQRLYNSNKANKEFVGYIMPRANSNAKSLEVAIFRGERGVDRHFKGLKRVELVDMAITILEKIEELHNLGIIIGDINGNNILVSSPSDVYFVDTDSYQISDLPCPVGTADFTAPEIQDKNYKNFLRTLGNENFAIAVLLFRILMLGHNPYAHINGETPAKNIKSGNFSYPYKENSNGCAPNSDAKYIWSHMFFSLKQMFYFTFKKGQCYYDEEERPTASKWLLTLKKYKKELTDGTIKNYDPVSLELIPKSYKKNPNITYIKCKLCGQDVSEDYTKEGYCYTCLNKVTIVKCSKCSRDIEYKNYNRYILKKQPPKYCKACFQKNQAERRHNKETYTTEICNCCGEPFDITYREYDFFKKKGLDLPKRCHDCRDAGRKPEYSHNNPNHGNPNDSSGGCFLTTVACEFYGKPDDCYELTILRNYRDHWLAHQRNGKELIREYYEIAPSIVKAIKESPDYAQICSSIMNNYINPCINLINSHQEQECRDLYISLVKDLKKSMFNI